MKKLLILSAFVSALFAISFSQDVEPLNVTIYKTPAPLFFDGDKDGMYLFTDPIPFGRWKNPALTPKPIDTALAWLLYDSIYLYGYVEVYDTEITSGDEIGVSIDFAEERTAPVEWAQTTYNANSFIFGKITKNSGSPHTFNNYDFRWQEDSTTWRVEFRIEWSMVTQTDSFYNNFFERDTFFLDMGIKNDGVEDEFLGWSNDSNTYWNSSTMSATVALGCNVMDKPDDPPDTTQNDTTQTDTLPNNFYQQEINSVKVYPNPTNSIINIQLAAGSKQIKIFNMRGELMLHTKPQKEITRLNIGHFEPGIYILQVEGEKCVIEKIIKT